MSFGGTFPARSFLLLPGKLKGGQHPTLSQIPPKKQNTPKEKEK